MLSALLGAQTEVTKSIRYSTISREDFDKFLEYTKFTLNPGKFTGVLSKIL